MKKIEWIINYFTKVEKILWSVSVFCIIVAFIIFDRNNYITLTASLIGITSLIFCAKGNPIGQVLIVCFIAFLVNDIYGFLNWRKMQIRQSHS